MTRLTPFMLETLWAAHDRNELLRRPGDPWPAPPASLHALVRRDLLTVSERKNRHGDLMVVWAITDAGRLVLHPPPVVRVDRPLFLARIVGARGDYTPIRAKAMDDLEVVDDGELNTAWSVSAVRRHDVARGSLDRAPGSKQPNYRRRAA